MQTEFLKGIRVLVTRPEHQASTFCQLVKKQGGSPVCLPVIEIKPIALSSQMQCLVDGATKVDYAIFISPNAVEHGLAALLAHGRIPDTLKLVTIGKASAQKMQQILGRAPDIYPVEQYNSEALLALDSLQSDIISNKKIIIFRGCGGRELLATCLRERGAEVDYVEAYQRIQPEVDDSQLDLIWGQLPLNGKPDIITVTSSEGLRNLLAIVKPQYLDILLQTPLVVVTEKVRISARASGFNNVIIVASKASNEAILDSVLEWAKINSK